MLGRLLVGWSLAQILPHPSYGLWADWINFVSFFCVCAICINLHSSFLFTLSGAESYQCGDCSQRGRSRLQTRHQPYRSSRRVQGSFQGQVSSVHINTGNTWRFSRVQPQEIQLQITQHTLTLISVRSSLSCLSQPTCHAGGEKMWRRRLRWSALWQKGSSPCIVRSCCLWSSTTVSMTSTLPVWRMQTLITSLWCWWWDNTPLERRHSSSKTSQLCSSTVKVCVLSKHIKYVGK